MLRYLSATASNDMRNLTNSAVFMPTDLTSTESSRSRLTALLIILSMLSRLSRFVFASARSSTCLPTMPIWCLMFSSASCGFCFGIDDSLVMGDCVTWLVGHMQQLIG